MIVSGSLQLDTATHGAATRLLAERLADLDTRRRAAEASVEGLLATWHGDAADAFQRQWEVWSEAASRVVDTLAASVRALPAARADLLEADASAAGTSVHLSGRLG